MGDRCGMTISADSPLDETLNQGPLALLLRRQYEFLFGINIVQFSIFQFSIIIIIVVIIITISYFHDHHQHHYHHHHCQNHNHVTVLLVFIT